MKKFNTSAASTTSHVEGIGIAKAAITALNSAMVDPCGLLARSTDFLGGTLELANYVTLQALVQPPGDGEILRDDDSSDDGYRHCSSAAVQEVLCHGRH